MRHAAAHVEYLFIMLGILCFLKGANIQQWVALLANQHGSLLLAGIGRRWAGWAELGSLAIWAVMGRWAGRRHMTRVIMMMMITAAQ